MIIAIVLLGIVSTSSSQPIHDMMTGEERQRIFGSSNASKVPEYDTVPIVTRSIDKNNSGVHITLKPFGKDLKMWLTPVDGLLAGEDMVIHTVETNKKPKSVTITTYQGHVKNALAKLYENKLNAATIAVNNHKDGKMSMTGFIEDFYIQPVPPRLMEHAKRQARAVNDKLDHEHDDDDHIYHIVHKVHHSKTKREAASQLQSVPKNDSQEIAYPEILVLVDYDLHLQFNQQMNETLLYVLAFWNGVDMRYRNFENPKIRLNIASIVMAMDSTALDYLEYSNGKKYTSGTCLKEQGRYLYAIRSVIPVENYDLAVTMTSHPLFDEDDISLGGAVLAKGVGKACHVDHQGKTMLKVAIVATNTAFNGIFAAAHELAHLFGVKHDGQVNKECPNEAGYNMATSNKFTNNSFDYSNCSLADLDKFLRSPQASCLFNKPNQGKPIHRFLPGQLADAHQQCRMLHVTRFFFKIDDSICMKLQCVNGTPVGDTITYIITEAAEGTTCGIGKLCLHGQCVFEKDVN